MWSFTVNGSLTRPEMERIEKATNYPLVEIQETGGEYTYLLRVDLDGLDPKNQNKVRYVIGRRRFADWLSGTGVERESMANIYERPALSCLAEEAYGKLAELSRHPKEDREKTDEIMTGTLFDAFGTLFEGLRGYAVDDEPLDISSLTLFETNLKNIHVLVEHLPNGPKE